MQDFTAVIVTRGDADLAPILASLPPCEVLIYDNSKESCDLAVYGRYHAASAARHDLIYTQDDDCVVDVAKILEAYDPDRVTCNMPAAKRAEYQALTGDGRIALVGWGACFHHDRLLSLQRYLRRWGGDQLFLRECDRVFTAMNPLNLVDVPFTNLPQANAEDRMGAEPRHLEDLREINRRIRATP